MGGRPVNVTVNGSALNAFPLAEVKAYDDMAGYLPPVNQPTSYQVTGVHFFDQAGSGRSDAEQIQTVKQAVTDYGGAGTYMYAGGYTLDNHNEQVL